jgi:hypothetical protein
VELSVKPHSNARRPADVVLNSRVVALPVRCPANKEVVAHFRVSAVVA